MIMGCFFGKLNIGFGLFPIGAPPHLAPATAASSKPHTSGRRYSFGAPHPHPRHPPPADPLLRLPIVFSPARGNLGWPTWLSAVAGDALAGWHPRRADSFQKLEKIGSGTYSNVYKARDLVTGRVVALKKVRMESVQSAESVRFMVREIILLRRLDHPNVVRLEGLVVSRVPFSPSLYLVFEYMDHDLAGLVSLPGVRFTESQVKCYIKQLLSGLEYCHGQGVLHRDIKCANLLLNQDGILKIADFGLATSFDPKKRKTMTTNVVTLWYRPPELLLGGTHYGVGVDLWSVGCILAELFTGKPILPGRTEVEQLHKIFKLCGSPSEDYFKKLCLQKSTSFRSYKRSIKEAFLDLPPSAVSLIDELLSLDPVERGSATTALKNEFFMTEPYACDPSNLPHYPPTKEMDRRLREAGRRQSANANENQGTTHRIKLRNASCRGPVASQHSAHVQIELDRRKLLSSASATSRTERFPPPHLDAAIGASFSASLDDTASFTTTDELFISPALAASQKNTAIVTVSSVDYLSRMSSRRNYIGRKDHYVNPSGVLIGAFKPQLIGPPSDSRRNIRSEKGMGRESTTPAVK
ncbi:putative serine/threonine-protein kinase At1g54610 isoform X1 [Curcuma longa]|uniref:putative serine/threonine-protein kinase At1g54610 isoform X1 n=1 Tax=Curcuma longa TaxID=136217 RepID=UPI003D9EE3A5